MTRINPPSTQTVTESHATGWMASFILHGALVFGAFVYLQQITLAPQTAPFTWNVAMVTPTGQTKPSPATAHQSARASEPTPRPFPAKTKAASQSIEPLTPSVDGRTPMPPTPPLLEDHTLSQRVEQAPLPNPTEPVAQEARAADSAIVPPLPASSALDTPLTSSHDSSTLQQATPSTEPNVASPSQAKPDKADYGWLADLMAQWIGGLNKRYPAMLRTDGVTGRVTLSAILHQNGTLSNVRVAKSSGNALLDQVAVEDIQEGPPVTLPRPLERPSMPVKFSIVYDLKTAR